MPPQAKLDRLVLDIVKLIPPCTESVTTISTGASAARKAASSAKSLQDNGNRELTAARMRRCERLLSTIRDLYAEFENRVDRLIQAVSFAASQPAKHVGSWNRLSDEWWLEKAIRIEELLSEVFKKREGLYNSWTMDGSNVRRSESYNEIVAGVSVAADDLKRCWFKLLEYVEEWEGIASIVHAGVGESGSLIPS